MNTGFLGPAVATVLTVYGIETINTYTNFSFYIMLQQYLPFTVLKPFCRISVIAELIRCNSTYRLRYWNLIKSSILFQVPWQLQQYLPFTVLKLYLNLQDGCCLNVATVLTVYGIETSKANNKPIIKFSVATVLTVYGIETILSTLLKMKKVIKLQQYLPFTVLKPDL